MSGRKEKEETKAIVKYVYPPEFEEVYATGARILVTSPHHVKLNFFWDKLQDDIAEEKVISTKGKMKATVSKKSHSEKAKNLISREFVASVTLSFPAFHSLAKALSDIEQKEMKGAAKSE